MSTEKELREDLDRSTRALERNLKQIETLTAELAAAAELRKGVAKLIAKAIEDSWRADEAAVSVSDLQCLLDRKAPDGE